MSILSQSLNQSAFGELMCAEMSELIQLQFSYNLSPELTLASVIGTGTVISFPPFALLSSPASASAAATFQSSKSLHYKSGQGASALFASLFTSGVAGSNQYIGVGDLLNGLFFGWNGSTFGILYRNSGVDTWIYQAYWNQDPFNGTGTSNVVLDSTKGNIYKIQYQGLGFGNVNFFIASENTGLFVLAHQIQYTNTMTSTLLGNFVLPLFARAESLGSSSLVQMQISAMAAAIEGIIITDNIRYAALGSLGVAALSTTLVLSIRNNVTYNGLTNPKSLLPNFVSASNQGSSNATLTYMLNPSVSASFFPVDTSTGTSVASFAVGGSVVSPGQTVLTQYIGSNSSSNTFIDFLNFNLNPGDILSVTALSGSSATVSVSFSWVEQF